MYLAELKVFEDQINLELLNNIITFVLGTANATPTQKQVLIRKCIFRNAVEYTDEFQQKYGFLYLGELLERYDERYGMSLRDRRAIALALGYTQDIQTEEMFVGNQRDEFLRGLLPYTQNDIYLAGAFYLLNAGRDLETNWHDQLYAWQYEKTEEIIFAMSLFQDFQQAFLHFKPQLLELLGKRRTITVLGNSQILAWFIVRIQPVIKTIRGKDTALMRALCALPNSFVKASSRHHGVLLENGYTPLEIVYANCMAVQYNLSSDCLSVQSITTEKIVVELFRQAFRQGEPFNKDIYHQLSELFVNYRNFAIRCYGHENLLDVLSDGATIQNAETFVWFVQYVHLTNPVFSAFDIGDNKWDALSTTLSADAYLSLFDRSLRNDMDMDSIQKRVNRYEQLTGEKYLDLYRKTSHGQQFSLLVEKGIVDLWEVFQNSIDDAGNVQLPNMMGYLSNYLIGIKTIQAFQFLQKFFPKYGVAGYKKYFSRRSDEFLNGNVDFENNIYSSTQKVKSVHLDRNYFEGDKTGPAVLLQWIEAYFFKYLPSSYFSFVIALLQNKDAADLLPKAMQKDMFNLIYSQCGTNSFQFNSLKEHYWTQEELDAEKAVQEAEKRKEKQREADARIQRIRTQYEEIAKGDFIALSDFIGSYRYELEKQAIACQIVSTDLMQFLAAKDGMLNISDASRFLWICSKLVKHKAIRLEEAKAYIDSIKEAVENDTEDNDD